MPVNHQPTIVRAPRTTHSSSPLQLHPPALQGQLFSVSSLPLAVIASSSRALSQLFLLSRLPLAVCLFPFLLLAQPQPHTITIKAIGGQGKTIRILHPLNGDYFPYTDAPDTLNADGSLTIPNNEQEPGAYDIVYHKTYRLYTHPGRSYTLTIDDNDKTAPIQVLAEDREGQLALNQLSFDFYQTAGMHYYRTDSLFAHNREKVLAETARQLAPFDQLYKEGKIDKAFHTYVTRLENNYQASVLAATLMHPLLKMIFSKDSAGYDVTKVREMDADWQQVRSLADPFDPANLTISTYSDYTFVYDQWYLGYYLPYSKGTYHPSNDPDDFWIRPYHAIRENYPEPLREYLLAGWITMVAAQQEFQPFILDWRRDFVQQYPHSHYTVTFTAWVDKVKDYQDKIRKDYSPAHRFLDRYDTISSFDNLAARFKGKTIYMDLWATWCGPCKQEFTYNESLRSFLQSKGVEILYLSIDNQSGDKRWKDMIKYYDLQGYHVRASDSLLKDIYRIFGQGPRQTLSIPRYALIKDGKMVLPNAKSPDEGQALYQQLAGLL